MWQEKKKRVFSHITCLCVSNSIVPLATIALTAGFLRHASFSKSLESQNGLVHARSYFLKRPVSLEEQSVFKTIFKQNPSKVTAGEMMPLGSYGFHPDEIHCSSPYW
jgi:hypothetical protein